MKHSIIIMKIQEDMSMIKLRGFHGTSSENAKSILEEQHFKHSENEQLRMGVGAYFFCQCEEYGEYAKKCARELEKFHKKKHPNGYAIMSCDIECEESQYLDLYDFKSLELFHTMRYKMLNRSLEVDENYKYKSAAVADTQVFDTIRKLRRVAVIRCPQYFGMFEEEQKFQFIEGRQFPKTFVPNVIMLCVNTNIANIKNIKIEEEGTFDGYEKFV